MSAPAPATTRRPSDVPCQAGASAREISGNRHINRPKHQTTRKESNSGSSLELVSVQHTVGLLSDLCGGGFACHLSASHRHIERGGAVVDAFCIHEFSSFASAGRTASIG
jgi:hypothetical protein